MTVSRTEYRTLLPNGRVLVATVTADLAALQRQQDNLRTEPTAMLEKVGGVCRRAYAKNFRAGGRPPWVPLKPRTMTQKARLLRREAIPARTPRGAIPRRFMQQERPSGDLGFGPWTILIEKGGLRDSWCVKGARGNVCRISGRDAYFGSQYSVAREVRPGQALKPYHIVTKRALAKRAGGGAVSVKVNLARIHEEGAPGAHIPARPVGRLGSEDWREVRETMAAFARGEQL